ncbi:MAG: RNA chaperone Hfq [Nitrospira bacterium HGW-Nitrospira-1]|nr:MAG: RNA chaperone Hfq [Nitrospira bacterium HGW-Nitrospira-1]
MSNSKGQSLQDNFLNQLRKDKIPVTIFLTNGVRLKGLVKAFDNFVILVKDVSQQLIYKHAVSTIVPEKDIDVSLESGQ